jgi:ABC-type bacteriocin/lantibiotic exporter with double-glycine peptidase domain
VAIRVGRRHCGWDVHREGKTLKRQSKSYWCGLASIANALEVLGIRRSQKELDRLCHVSAAAGTDEVEMKRALLAQRDVAIDEWNSNMVNQAMTWLEEHLMNRGPAILCVDDDDHWITVIGMCDESFIVFDPSRNQGVEVHNDYSLAARWVNSDGVYYGIGVSR